MKKVVNLLSCFFITALIFYSCFIIITATIAYKEIKQKSRGWYGRVHKYDDSLGFSPIPNARGMHVFPIGPDVPMRYNKNGFRVPLYEDLDMGKRPLFLFLGCSYTYGDGCLAEDTFPYLIGKYFNGTSINAGVCGYGLTQLYVLAQKLIPQYRPNVVIVQYSDWLINRATRPFSPTYFTRIPHPYFTEQQGKFKIAPPVYRTNMFDYDFSYYRTTRKSIFDYCSFLCAAAIPLKIYDDINYLIFCIKKIGGLIVEPTEKKQEVCDFFYKEMQDLCNKYSAKMIILGLGDQSYRINPELIYINTEEGLKKNLKSVSDYSVTYRHWRGNPPSKVDNHPNPLAHQIIASQVIEKIKVFK